MNTKSLGFPFEIIKYPLKVYVLYTVHRTEMLGFTNVSSKALSNLFSRCSVVERNACKGTNITVTCRVDNYLGVDLTKAFFIGDDNSRDFISGFFNENGARIVKHFDSRLVKHFN